MVNLRVRMRPGPRTTPGERVPARQQHAQQRTPAVEVAAKEHGARRIEGLDVRTHASILAKRTVAEMRAVNGENVERATGVTQLSDDQCPLHLFAR